MLMKKRTTVLILVVGLITSCGYRGALYLPDEAQANTESSNQTLQEQENEDK